MYLLLFISFCILITLIMSSFIIEENKCCIKQRFGKFHSVLNSGWHINIPFIDQMKHVGWSKTVETSDRNLSNETFEGYLISLNQIDLDFPPYKFLSSDGCEIIVNGIMHYKIIDPKKAVYEIDDLWKFMQTFVQTTMRSVIIQKTYNQLIKESEILANNIKTELQKNVDNFGIFISKMEIQEIIPNKNLLKVNEDRLMELQNIKIKMEHDKANNECQMVKQELDYNLELKQKENIKKLQNILFDVEINKCMALRKEGFTNQQIIMLLHNQNLSKLYESSNSKIIIPYDSKIVHSLESNK